MGRNRVTLRRIALIGPGSLVAEVRFGPALNVVYGPSDTGKSYIARSIDYVLGARTLVPIPESGPYTAVEADFQFAEGVCFRARRPLSRGRYDVTFSGTNEPRPALSLPSKHSKNGSSFSAFFLEALGLGRVHLRRNQQGATQEFTVRTLALLTVIDETKIQDELCPPFSGLSTSRDRKSVV